MQVLSAQLFSETFLTPVPTTQTVEKICGLANPVNRNLQITACYNRLSISFAIRAAAMANWCTFATWASKQAGVTIRGEDLIRKLQLELTDDPEIRNILQLLLVRGSKLGCESSIAIDTLQKLVESVKQKASNAVARGNKKVFEEIGYEFARFIQTCLKDDVLQEAKIASFCTKLRGGPPPNGQAYLQRAFTLYYQALFEPNSKMRDEMIFLANIQVGFHEQTRLQPEIAESLNAASIDPAFLRKQVTDLIVNGKDLTGKLAYFFNWLLGRTSPFKKAIDLLVAAAEKVMRRVITKHLMSLTLPPDHSILLSEDLNLPYPATLIELENRDLIDLLKEIRPSIDAIDGAGCKDWSNLKERMHFIANLFRCYHFNKDLFADAFSKQQLDEIEQGKIPEGLL